MTHSLNMLYDSIVEQLSGNRVDRLTPPPRPKRAPKAAPPSAPPVHQHPAARHAAGTAPGINIRPGSDDDGWTVPPPVQLEDGTRVQLYKDGEALHAAYEAIKHARRRVCLQSYIFADDDTGHAFAE